MNKTTNLQVIKRDGDTVPFDGAKIKSAILKAMQYGNGISHEIARLIAKHVEERFEGRETVTIPEIEQYVCEQLIHYHQPQTALAYEGYRRVQAFKRETNTIDESITGLLEATNYEVMNENSNKNGLQISTQRDLMAGEISKDYVRRKRLPANIVQAHDEGILHYHDLDYAAQRMFNCCLVNIQDMLDNGTVINKRKIDTPNGFQVACTVMTQIIAQVASNQYGGQSLNIKHLGKYLKRSEDKWMNILADDEKSEAVLKRDVEKVVQKELSAGIQTIQYQINTLMTTNGQSPFVTLFLELDPNDEYIEYTARIIEELLKQRIKGIKNEKGIYTTPTFPKLVYVLDEHNCLEGGKYDYLTEIAVECSSKRLYPDYISAKEMRKAYEGNVFSPMGCRSFLSPWKNENGDYQFEGRFNLGVVSLNLPQIGLVSSGDEEKFFEVLNERLELCYKALMTRYEFLKGTVSDVSPVHWQYGAIARLKSGESIDKLLVDGYATISLGYIGLYEATLLTTGESNTTPKGEAFALKVLTHLKKATERWKAETGLGFGLYGSPAESLCYRFAKIDKAKFGVVENVTDKGYYTNSYHVDVREEIDAFSKLQFESQFQPISSGGCISYVEIPHMGHNIEALQQLVNYIYHNIQYAEFNTKADVCQVCDFEGEIMITDDHEWECPNCGNRDKNLMNVVRRTCGYLGDNFWNEGKTKEIKARVLHL